MTLISQIASVVLASKKGNELPLSSTINSSDFLFMWNTTLQRMERVLYAGGILAPVNSVNGLTGVVVLPKLNFISITQPVDLDQLEARVNELDSAIVLQGTWDASNGTFPGGGNAQRGYLYIVSVAGTVSGVEFNANDRIIALLDDASETVYNTNWFKEDYTDAVLSVNGETGAIINVAKTNQANTFGAFAQTFQGLVNANNGLSIVGTIFANSGNQGVHRLISLSDAPLSVESSDGTTGINFKDTTGNDHLFWTNNMFSTNSGAAFGNDLSIIKSTGANIFINSNNNSVNNGVYLTEGVNKNEEGAYVHYNGSNNHFVVATGVTTMVDRLLIHRDTGLATFSNDVSITGTTSSVNFIGAWNSKTLANFNAKFDSSNFGKTQIDALGLNYNSLSNKPTTITAAQTSKLSGIESGAQVNVKSNWNAISGDAQILNKPNTITGSQITKLSGIEDNAEVNVKADWNATTGDAEILNKPTIPSIGSEYVKNNEVTNYTKQQYFGPQNLTYAATTQWNLDNEQKAIIVLTGNTTMGNPTNVRNGSTVELIVEQDATGGRLITWDALYDFGSDGVPSLSTQAARFDILVFEVSHYGSLCFIGIKKGFNIVV